MAITRASGRKVFSFKSAGESVELRNKLANSQVEVPPVGIVTPVTLAEDGKSFLKMHKNFPDQIHDNLRNLVLTNHGERLGLHDFGANLAELTFELQDEDVQGEAMSRVSKAVRKYMPYVSLETFSPFVENFENEEVARIGITIGYKVPKLRTQMKMLDVLLYCAG